MSDSGTFGAKEAFEIYTKHREVIFQMVSLYATGTLAVLGFTIGAEKATRRLPEVVAILIGYVVFAAGNGWAVVSSQAELNRMARGIDVLLRQERSAVVELFGVIPIAPQSFVLFYFVVTLLVCLVIGMVSYARANRAALQA